MLIHFGVMPYIVFDGDYLPSKAATEAGRAKKREESKRKGLELYRLNKPSQAHLELQKAVDVTPEMARQFIEELKKIGVQYVVAPYEADAQLAYLEQKGIIHGVLSEDSDLLVFGAKRLLTKLNQYGDCVEINRADFTACQEVSLVGWSDAEFRRMAILSGCDYLASINKMGLKSAYRYVRKYKTIEKILRMLAFDGQYHVPAGYLEKFQQAELTFLHQRVFCPLKNNVVMMNDCIDGDEPTDFSFIGGDVEQSIAIGVSKGDLNPMTKQPIQIKDTATTAPKTPWGYPCRISSGTCSDVKTNKSIDAFFKTKRTPLAELDPNSFTPSPTQQRLMRQASVSSWESSPVPARPPRLRASTSLPLSSTHSTPSTRNSQNVTNSNKSASGQKSSKRQRLCPDSDEDTELTRGLPQEVGRSHFFANNPESEPPPKPSRKNRKGRQADITIWSDDSIEDAMAELSNVPEEQIPAKTGKRKVFNDPDPGQSAAAVCPRTQENEGLEDDSQCSSVSRGTECSEVTISTEATSITSSSSSVAQTLDKNVTAELKALTSAFAYQPQTEKMQSQRREIQHSTKRPGSDGLRQHHVPSQLPKMQQRRSMTPLQRLGVGALNRSRSCNDFSNQGKSTSVTDGERDLIGNKAVKSIENDAGSKSGAVLPANRITESTTLAIKGSEDAIPDSEDSADDVQPGPDGQTKRVIHLGRFAFAN